MTNSAAISPSDIFPRLKTGVRLSYDKARSRWVILAPERMLMPDESALEILRLCDGNRSLAEIAQNLAKEYDASADRIADDARALLEKLRGGGVVEF